MAVPTSVLSASLSLDFFSSWSAQTAPLKVAVANEVIVHKPIAQVFEFATVAKNWKEWHPNTLKTAGADNHSATVGEEIIEWVNLSGLHTVFFWEVTAHVEPTVWKLVGESEDRSLRFFLTYTLEATSAGATRFRRELVYEMKKSFFSVFWNFFFMEPYIRITSEEAVLHFRRVLEAKP
jgi:hypothetical protein